MSRRSTYRSAVLALVAAAACSDGTVDGRATIRLSTRQAEASGVDAALLVDRDTTTKVGVTAPVTVRLRFAHAVEIRRVKVHGARAVRVGVGGEEIPAADGWSALELSKPITTDDLHVTLDPLGADAELRELELWGAGHVMAGRNLEALARASRSGSAREVENAWVLRAATADAVLQPPGAGEGSPCLRTTFPRADPRQARRAYLVFEADVPRPEVLSHSVGGGAPVAGVWLGATPDQRTLVREVDPESLRAAGGSAALPAGRRRRAGPRVRAAAAAAARRRVGRVRPRHRASARGGGRR